MLQPAQGSYASLSDQLTGINILCGFAICAYAAQQSPERIVDVFRFYSPSSFLNTNCHSKANSNHHPLMATRKTVLITGCSDGGIGYGLAHQFLQRGYHVFATARDISKMSKLKDLPNVTLFELDVVKPSQIKAAVEAVTKRTGGTLDFLISNAGHNHFMPILDEDMDQVRALFEVNTFGPMMLTKAFAPLILKAKGVIVFVTSISGYVNTPWMGKLHLSSFAYLLIDSFTQGHMQRQSEALSSLPKLFVLRSRHLVWM
jgi:hypothetical protein